MKLICMFITFAAWAIAGRLWEAGQEVWAFAPIFVGSLSYLLAIHLERTK